MHVFIVFEKDDPGRHDGGPNKRPPMCLLRAWRPPRCCTWAMGYSVLEREVVKMFSFGDSVQGPPQAPGTIPRVQPRNPRDHVRSTQHAGIDSNALQGLRPFYTAPN